MTYIVSSQSSLSFFNLISYSLFFSSFCYISLYCRITILNIVFLYRCCHILIITRWVPIQRCLEGTLHACILHTLKLRISPILFKMTFPLSIFSTSLVFPSRPFSLSFFCSLSLFNFLCKAKFAYPLSAIVCSRQFQPETREIKQGARDTDR